MTKDEENWHEDAEKYGWQLPQPAAKWKRLPIIRTIRWAYLKGQTDKHNRFYRSMGMIPTGYDEWVLYAVARGWC